MSVSAYSPLTALTTQTGDTGTSAAFTPTAGGQLIAIVAVTGSVGDQGVPDSITATHTGQGAFSLIFSVMSTTLSHVSFFVYASTTGGSPGSGTISVNMHGTASPADWNLLVGEYTGASGTYVGAPTTPVLDSTTATNSATLSATPNAVDRVLIVGAARNKTSVQTVGTTIGGAGGTIVHEVHHANPVANVAVEDIGGYTGTTIDIAGQGAIANDLSGIIVKAAGSTLPVNQTDSSGLTDSVSIQFVRGVNQTDDSGLTDSSATAFIRGVNQTDDAGLTDSPQTLMIRNVTQTDSAGLTDSPNTLMIRGVNQTDDSGLTDSFTLQFIRVLTITDSVGLADSSTATVFPPPVASATDVSGLTDSFTIQIIHGGIVAGSIMDQIMQDLITRGYLVGTAQDRERQRLIDATGAPNNGAGKTIDDLYSLNNERNRIALESVAIIPKT